MIKSKIQKCLITSVCVLFTSIAIAAPGSITKEAELDVYFSPKQGATESIVSFIQGAKKSIRVAAYSFTSAPIANALVEAHQRGIDVAVVLDKSNETGRYSSATYLENHQVPIRINHRYKIMHNKYIIVDNINIQTGSFNYTKAAEEGNAENALILKNVPSLAQQYLQNWQQLWYESTGFLKKKKL